MTDANENRDPPEVESTEPPGIVHEFVDFLRYNKIWWMTPIILVILALVGLAILLPTPVAPFIYTLF